MDFRSEQAEQVRRAAELLFPEFKQRSAEGKQGYILPTPVICGGELIGIFWSRAENDWITFEAINHSSGRWLRETMWFDRPPR